MSSAGRLLSERDVVLLRSRAENQVRIEQLRLSQIDATAVIPPLNFQARREGMNILVSTRDIYPLPLQGLVVRIASLDVPAERAPHLRFARAAFRASVITTADSQIRPELRVWWKVAQVPGSRMTPIRTLVSGISARATVRRPLPQPPMRTRGRRRRFRRARSALVSPP